jgi:signal transduction histidine kinase
MSVTVSCPQCKQPIDPQSRYCGNCGVDVAIAAVLAEKEVRLPVEGELPAGGPLSPELLVPRLGEYLVEQGQLTQAGLEHALRYQREKVESGDSVLLGEALRELGYVDAATLDKAVTIQILKLQRALYESNRRLEQRVKERTKELRRALNRLTELSQLKANFIANISHELRTPLTHLRGYLEMLAEQALGPMNPDQAEAIKVILRAESRLERLIEDLIQFSLAAQGDFDINISSFNLRETVRAVADQAMSKVKSAGVTLNVKISDQLPLVQGDEEKIMWGISQLVDNACKFTPEGGRVWLETFPDGEYVTVAVTDTGIGIQEHRIQEIFEPFHQLDGAATRRYNGTGLGLALLNRVLKAHGSKVEVKSRLNEGSRFEFKLPAHIEAREVATDD